MEKFSPTVVIDGVTYTPEGWMWVLSFALAGHDWAVKTVMDPEYNLRGRVDDYNRRGRTHFAEVEIGILERRLAQLKEQL